MTSELREFFNSFKNLFKSILSFEKGTDVESAIEGIKRDITFRGHSAWILIFSIFIASIGLNVNSTAVIIGAMLISPLMGPILGIGLAIGTNDTETLIKSVKNIALAVVISLLTSTLYFLITPLNIEQSELLSRTKPTILDVLVALFGGFAGIIAVSRKEKTNVIPGVAIATALMPPLCTAGYALANLKMGYFLGAFYLFFINSVFITLSTFLVVRYLNFPLVKFLDTEKSKRYRYILVTFLVLTITPSTIIFYSVIQETRFRAAAEQFVSKTCNDVEGSELLNYKIRYSDTLSTIDLYYIGNKIDEATEYHLKDKLADLKLSDGKWFSVTAATDIRVHQELANNVNLDERFTDFNNNFKLSILEDIYTKNEEQIHDKELKISLLEAEVMRLSAKDNLPHAQLRQEMSLHFPKVEKYSFANAVELNKTADGLKYDTIPMFLIRFKGKQYRSVKAKVLEDVGEWLRVRLNDSTIQTISY